MKTNLRRPRSAILALVIIALLLLMAVAAGPALAEGDDMQGMPGMTDEEMQGMTAPETGAATDDAHGGPSVAGAHDAMGGSSVDWLVIGGFGVLIAGSTVAAAATKRHLRRRMLAGELAGAGVQNV
jgi:hypothetical protein